MDGEKVEAAVQVADSRVRFIASQLSRAPTGIHARLTLALNTTILAYTYCNVERDEDRVRLSNSAHRLLGPQVSKLYAKEQLKHDLDLFVWGLWAAWQSNFKAVEMVGDPLDMEPEFVLRPYVMEGGGSILFSPPGRGKSYMGLIMAICVDAGLNDFWQVAQVKTIFVNLERSWQSVRRRITAINQALGLDPARPLLCFHARGKSLADVREPLARDIKAKGVGLVVLDSLSRTGMGDLNENRPVNATIDTLNALCPTWLALAHTPRGDESHIFGGIHFDAGADIVIQLSSQTTPKSLGLGLQVTKANDMRTPRQEIFRLSFDGFALTSFEKAREKEFGQIEKGRKQQLPEAVLEYLFEKEQASATELAEATGFSRQKVTQFLLNDSRIIKVGKDGREVLYKVVPRLDG